VKFENRSSVCYRAKKPQYAHQHARLPGRDKSVDRGHFVEAL
jgi:hypothetical protein